MAFVRRTTALVFVASSVIALAGAGSAYAKPTTGSGGSTGSASCSASPNPVPVGTSYYVNGAGLTAGAMVDVFATDSSGSTSSVTASVDSTGHVSVVEHAWVSGPASAKITDTTRKHNLLASCGFSIS